jgi:hypothetical protein
MAKKESDIESHGLVEHEQYKLMYYEDIFDCVLSINIFFWYKHFDTFAFTETPH